MKKIRASGGYRQLKSFQTATIVYDGTYWFCERFLDQRSRTCDQMIQAARSGRQNIAEASRAGAVSSQTELRLTNVARASLEELLLDYEDFLRHRHLVQWAANGAEAQTVRSVGRKWTDRTNTTNQTDKYLNTHAMPKAQFPCDTNATDLYRPNLDSHKDKNQSNQSNPSHIDHPLEYSAYSKWLDHHDPAVRANALICLIHQTNYLLDRQIHALETAFITTGGYSEQLASARLSQRNIERNEVSAPNKPPSSQFPPCPVCGAATVLRTARQGKEPGKQFFGCSTYPSCKGVAKL